MAETAIVDSDNRTDLMNHDFVTAVVEQANTAEGARQKHIQNFERYYKKRFGIRPTRSNWPWLNAANLHLPLIDKSIRQAKPKFIRLLEAVNPMATLMSNILGDDLKFVMAIERKFDHMMRFDMKILEKYILGVDKMLEKGYYLAKVVQEFTPIEINETVVVSNLPDEFQQLFANGNDDDIGFALADRFDMDPDDDNDVAQIKIAIAQLRGGKDILKFKRKKDLTDFPSMFIRDPIKILVPSYTTDIQTAQWIRDRMTLSFDSIFSKAQSDVWHKGNTLELLKRLDSNTSRRDKPQTGAPHTRQTEVERLEDIRTGINRPHTSLPDVDEYYFWYHWKGDRLPHPSVLTLHSGHTDLPLRFIKYPYVDTFGRPDLWPIAQVSFEIVSDKYHSQRGFPQMLDSLQTEITNNHNAKQNYLAIATSLNIKAKRNANVSTNWIPGQPLWVNRMDDAEVMQFGEKHDASYDNEERILLGWAEGYIGLENALSRDNSLTEPRTKAEVDKISAIQDEVSYGDSVVVQIGNNKIFNMIWNRWMQYGPDKIKIITPDTGVSEIHKDEIRTRFKLVPTGNVSNSALDSRRQKAIGRLQLYKDDPFINQFELRRQALELDDERLAQILLVPQSEVIQGQVERQILEISMISAGYTVVPKLSDDDATHISVIEDFFGDEKKNKNFPPERLEALILHREAHKLSLEKKKRATSRGGRIQQEISNVAQGTFGREARNAIQET